MLRKPRKRPSAFEVEQQNAPKPVVIENERNKDSVPKKPKINDPRGKGKEQTKKETAKSPNGVNDRRRSDETPDERNKNPKKSKKKGKRGKGMKQTNRGTELSSNGVIDGDNKVAVGNEKTPVQQLLETNLMPHTDLDTVDTTVEKRGRYPNTNKLKRRKAEKDACYGFEDFDEQSINRPVALPTEDGSVLVVMGYPAEVPFKGRASISCIAGEVDIMGYRIDPSKSSEQVFSPDCNSLVTIVTKVAEKNIDIIMQNAKKKLNVSEGDISYKKLLASLLKIFEIKENIVVLKFEKIETNFCKFISSFRPYPEIFKTIQGDKSFLNKKLLPLEVFMPSELSVPQLTVPAEINMLIENWNEALQIEDAPVMLVCGGKSSGKSTTNRLIINSSLNLKPSVYFLECDVGQTEFTPSGVVSLVHVQAPVFGPPFCHQRKPECAYFYGGVSPKDEPDHYLRCLQMCVQHYKQLQNPGPLIVNTMGWLKDLGWQLLLDTIRMVCPSHIVQLTSHEMYQNIDAINPHMLEDVSWSQLSQNSSVASIGTDMSREPKFTHIEYPISPRHDFKLSAMDYRNLAILSHLGNNIEPGMTLTSLTPYIVEWKNVCVHVCNVEVERSQVMYALNAGLVALCSVDTSESERLIDDGPMFVPPATLFQWRGFGIVRGIDPVRKLFYIVTSLSVDQLSGVNAIVKGGVVIPERLLTLQKGVKLLYTDEVVSSVGIHCKKPRKRMARVSFPK